MAEIACPRCNSTESLGFDWTGVVTARIESGQLKYVQAGGVFGVNPDTVNCSACDYDLIVPEALGQQVVDFVTAQGYTDDGWDLAPNKNRRA